MRSVRFLCVAVLLSFVIAGSAEERQAPAPADPRVGLKAGMKDAGQAARNLELVASLPKPPGFFDPKTARRRADASREGSDRKRKRKRRKPPSLARSPIRARTC